MHRKAAAPCRAAAAIALILGAGLIPALTARATSFDTTTVAGPLGPKPIPSIVLDPLTQEPHLLYVNQTTAWHARRTGGVWLYEAVTSSISGVRLILAVGPSGRLAAGFFKVNGRFVCSVSDGGGWVEDSSLVDVTSCASCLQWLAMDPLSNEPCVAYTVALPTLPVTYAVRYATRQGGLWSISDVDSVPVGPNPLSLAVDGQGRPYVAYTNYADDSILVGTRGLANAPFTHEVAAAGMWYWHLSAAVDPASGEPRVAYYSQDTTSFLPYVGYATRDFGPWLNQLVDSSSTYYPRAVSLAIDACGYPAIVYTCEIPILATRSATRDGGRGNAAPSSAEDGGTSGEVWLARRPGAAGLGPFSLEPIPVHDLATGSGALAVSPAGGVHVAARHPDMTTGPNYSVLLAETADPLGVPSPMGGALALAAPAPNPGRGDQVVRVSFVLPRDERATLELLDLEGRRVAHLPARSYHAGLNALQWSPGPLPAGLYWLRLHSASGLSATRKWVVLR